MMRAKRLLLIWILMVIAARFRPFVAAITGPSLVNYTYIYLLLLSVPVLILTVLRYRRELAPLPRTNSFQLKVALMLVLLVLLTAYGLLGGNRWQNVVRDAGGFIFILCFFVLGRYDQVWKDLEKPLLVFFYVLLVFVVIGFWMPRFEAAGIMSLREADLGASRGSTNSAGYELSAVLNFWPIVFLVAFQRKAGLGKLLGLGTLAVFLSLQFYFQKRAPTARAFGYVFMVAFFLPMLQKKMKFGTTMVVALSIGVVMAVVMAGPLWGKLMRRFSEQESFWQSSRVVEARTMLNQQTPVEWIAGKGMGGWFAPPPGWPRSVQVTKSGLRGNTVLHIGVLYPLLKGGLLLFFLYYSFFLPLFYRKPFGWYDNPYNTAAMAALPVYWLFLLIEGPPTIGAGADCFFVGMIAARMATPVTVPAEGMWVYADDGLANLSEVYDNETYGNPITT